MKKVPFTQMHDTARHIESLALLLRHAAETGQLSDMGDEVIEDAAAMIQESASQLKEMIKQAQAEAAQP